MNSQSSKNLLHNHLICQSITGGKGRGLRRVNTLVRDYGYRLRYGQIRASDVDTILNDCTVTHAKTLVIRDSFRAGEVGASSDARGDRLGGNKSTQNT